MPSKRKVERIVVGSQERDVIAERLHCHLILEITSHISLNDIISELRTRRPHFKVA